MKRLRSRAPGAAASLHPRIAVRANAQEVYRDSIRAAAERVFAARGFATTKMTDIAREAGMSVGTLYNYFENKDDIISDLFCARGDECVGRLEAISAGEPDPAARLGALIASCLGFIEEHREVVQVFFQMNDSVEGAAMPVCGAAADRNRQRVNAILSRAIRAGIASGALRDDLTAADMLAFVGGAINGFVDAWCERKGRTGLVRKAPVVVDLILRGAATKP
jgi:AcrR family transcriptional regulator